MDSKDLYIKQLEDTIEQLQKQVEELISKQTPEVSSYGGNYGGNVAIGYQTNSGQWPPAIAAGDFVSNPGSLNYGIKYGTKANYTDPLTNFMDYIEDSDNA